MKQHAVHRSFTGIALIALFVTPWVHSSFAKSQRASRVGDRPAHIAALSCLPLLADFDGDRRLDRAELHSIGAHHSIYLRFGNWRETYLESGSARHTLGKLLARDVNHDNKSDLIWLSQLRSEPALIWLGDGLGNFAQVADRSLYESELRSQNFGDAEPEIGEGSSEEEQACLAPDPISSELPRATNVETELTTPPVIAGSNSRRDLGLYLSYLRERGPPLNTRLV
jgi:hypothetical protein